MEELKTIAENIQRFIRKYRGVAQKLSGPLKHSGLSGRAIPGSTAPSKI